MSGMENASHNRISILGDSIHVSVLPEHGGKITSIYLPKRGLELLHLPLRDYSPATHDSGFDLSDAGGWDECLPTVSACTHLGRFFPDHGDLWRIPWSSTSHDKVVEQQVDATTLPLHFSRRLLLEDDRLTIHYSVENMGPDKTEFLWSAHPLFQVDEGDRILLPSDIRRVRVEGSTLYQLQAKTIVNWPCPTAPDDIIHDLSIVGPQDARTSYKFFAGPLKHGWCALWRDHAKVGIILCFDPKLLPYLGLWISLGAWPEREGARQYCVALEPTTSPCDSLREASSGGTARSLVPGQQSNWKLELKVYGTSSPLTKNDFEKVVRDLASQSPPVD